MSYGGVSTKEMATLGLVNLFDIARSLGDDPKRATPHEVRDWLWSNYLSQTGGGFNYDTAIHALELGFRGAMTEGEAIRYCMTHGNAAGRSQNAAVVRAAWKYVEANQGDVYRSGYSAVVVGRHRGIELMAGVKAPFVRVRDGVAYCPLPMFRSSFRPSGLQLDFCGSVLAALVLGSDFEEAMPEYLITSPVGVGHARYFNAILGSSRRLWSSAEVDRVLGIYVEAVGMLLADGHGRGKPRLTGYRVIDPDNPPFI